MAVWINDIPRMAIGETVTISGIVVSRRKKGKDNWYITIKDYSGEIGLLVTTSEFLPVNLFWNRTVLQLTGTILKNDRGSNYLSQICDVFVIAKANNNTVQISNFDSELNQKAANILMSDTCRLISTYLRNNNYVEFESSVISRTWQSNGLEPVNVLYPGFGSHVKLITSPSPQIVGFLKTAMVARAFTSTKSFATTYRFKEGSSELRVIMAKALDLPRNELIKTLINITVKIIEEFGDKTITIPNCEADITYLSWEQRSKFTVNKEVNVVVYSTNLDASYSGYSSKIENIIHIMDLDKNILAEGSYEKLANGLFVSTITIYPSQFLNLLNKTPARQLRELWRKYGWE